MKNDNPLDLVIIGGGIGGIIGLYYARKSGLNALLLEKQGAVGGLWAQLPNWQDIQFGRIDWTLGDLPIEGEDQRSILKNIQAWVDRFNLAPYIRLDTTVQLAKATDSGWTVLTSAQTYTSRYLISATGGHNRPIVPPIDRSKSSIKEYHSAALRDPTELAGKEVMVVGGGASAYDLLDLCLEHKARRIVWIYRSLRWMVPTRKPKNVAGSVRGLAKQQMLGNSVEEISRDINQDLRGRYEKFGLQEILPEHDFDLNRDQLIPGRRGMIEHFSKIERHRGQIASIEGQTVRLSSGGRIGVDLILWGTGYEIDLSYFASPTLAAITRIDDLAKRCSSVFRSLDEPNLFFLSVLLDSTGTAPWAYALACRSIVSQIRNKAHFDTEPTPRKINHFDLAKFLAERDPDSYPPGVWRSEYEKLAFARSENEPMPIP